jgi:hypothetical protein
MTKVDTHEDVLRDRILGLTGRLSELTLVELGEFHRALKAALADVKAAMEPVIVREAHRGMTYVELAHTTGYGSFTTIAKIMRVHPVPKGPRPFR